MPLVVPRHDESIAPEPSVDSAVLEEASSYSVWHPYTLVGDAAGNLGVVSVVLVVVAVLIFLYRRRLRTNISRIFSQALEVAALPIHIHIYGNASQTTQYSALPVSPSSPTFAPFAPSANPISRIPQSSSSLDVSSNTRQLRVNVPSNRSVVEITRTPASPESASYAYYPASPYLSDSTSSTPTLSESNASSPRSETGPLTPPLTMVEEVTVHGQSPAPSKAEKPSPLHLAISTPRSPRVSPVSIPLSPTVTISIHTSRPSQSRHSIAPPNIILTSVPSRPPPEVPMSPPHTLGVPSRRRQRPAAPSTSTPPPPYEPRRQSRQGRSAPVAAPSFVAQKPNLPARSNTPINRPIPTIPPPPSRSPANLSNTLRSQSPAPRVPVKRAPPPPPKPIIPFELEPIYPLGKPEDVASILVVDETKMESKSISFPGLGIELARESRTSLQARSFSGFGEKVDGRVDYSSEEEVESPSSAKMFFKGLLDRSREVSKREEARSNVPAQRGGLFGRMSALAKRAVNVIERELDSGSDEDEDERQFGWPARGRNANVEEKVMPYSVAERLREREQVFVIGDEEED